MRAIMKSRGMAVGCALLATAAMSGCSANGTPSSTGPSDGQTTLPATSAATSPPAGTPASASAGTPSATPATAGGVRHLAISTAVRGELTAAFVAHKGISPSDVAGIYPGSVYYAYDPATNTYWAVAQFESSSTAPVGVLVSFQDGGNFGLFRRVGEARWQVRVKISPPACTEPQFFPRAVLMAWSLPTSTPVPTTTNSFHC